MIRKANDSEIDRLMAITKACAAKMSAAGIHQWNENYPYPEAFHVDMERGELFVVEKENEIAACITISTVKDEVYEPVRWLSEDGINYYVHRLAVHPDYQHQGIARQLMDFAESYVRENNGVSIRLDTFSKNLRNQQFYEARGYSRLEEIFFPKQSEFPFYCYELLLK